jgi:enamine deaminase RidA (YjgF/YER057c/UK114 family)
MSANRELINPPGLHPAHGYSHVAIAMPGRIAYIAGQVPLDADFNVVGEGDLGEQTKAAMRNIKTVLDALGASWDNVMRRTVYTVQPRELETITTALQEAQGNAEPPPATVVGVTALAVEGLLIEIEDTVHLPS